MASTKPTKPAQRSGEPMLSAGIRSAPRQQPRDGPAGPVGGAVHRRPGVVAVLLDDGESEPRPADVELAALVEAALRPVGVLYAHADGGEIRREPGELELDAAQDALAQRRRATQAPEPDVDVHGDDLGFARSVGHYEIRK